MMKRHPALHSLIAGWLFIIPVVNGLENPRIVVIGAGAAGIAATSHLYQAGLSNIVLLEASERIGGRIHTTPFGSGIVEIGAQWCHGEQDNVVYELASVYPGLLSSSIVKENSDMIQSDGTQVPDDTVETMKALAGWILDSDERDSFNGSLGQFFTEKYWQTLQSDTEYYNISQELAEQFLTYFHNLDRGYEAYDTWFEVPAKDVDHYIESDGDPALAWNSPKGYSTILDIVSGNYPEPVRSSNLSVPLAQLITYGRFVSNILWDGTPNGTVLVTTEDGERYEADHVIVTVSLGVLKKHHHTMFTPALPIATERAITGLYFGTVNKIFLLFDAPIPEHLANIRNLFWYKSELEALRRSRHAWVAAVSLFFRVDHQPNVLALWLNGAEGGQTELLSDDIIREGVLHVLNIFAKNVTFGNLQTILRTKWSTDRLFLGSYSSRSITTKQLSTGAEYLSQPLNNVGNKPVVLFAGEATNRERYATVHGAIESGFREAKRLLAIYQPTETN